VRGDGARRGGGLVQHALRVAPVRGARDEDQPQGFAAAGKSSSEPLAEGQTVEAPPEVTQGAAIDEALRAALEEKGSAYDSHPAPAQRIAWVERAAAQHAEVVDDGAPAWDLLDDRDALQAQMTELVNGRVQLAVAMHPS
jgi:hypothetical protein